MDGVMTNHEIQPGADASHSVLTVTGEDLSRVMDYIDFSGFLFPGMPPEARVGLILLKYAFLGIIPLVIPSVLIDIPIPTDRIPAQQGKDLTYIRSPAEEVGYVFYIESGPEPGMSVAYWGPEIKVGVPQKALSINMDAASNLESISSCSFNSQGRGDADRLHPESANPYPDSNSHPRHLAAQSAARVGPAHSPQLRAEHRDGEILPDPRRRRRPNEAARSAEVVSVKGSLNVARYGLC